MRRFFFDLWTSAGHPLPDYEGREFQSDQDARCYAEKLITQLIESDQIAWTGAAVVVFSRHGSKLFSIPVKRKSD
jgi:hypothetical protein